MGEKLLANPSVSKLNLLNPSVSPSDVNTNSLASYNFAPSNEGGAFANNTATSN